MPSMSMTSELGRHAFGSWRRSAGLCVALLLPLSTASPVSAAEAVDGVVPGLATIEDAEVDAIVADIDRAVELATAQLEALRSERLHLDVVVEQVGTEPEAIREWVAESTSWVPYRGLLRGAEGVLLDRTGSSLDRSLLLAALLVEAGYPTRLARAELDSETSERIVAANTGTAAVITPQPVLASATEVAAHREAVSRTSDALMGLIEPAADGADPRRSALAAAADHWWVQAELDGAWVDLDPAGIAEPPGTVTPDALVDPTDVSEELQHQLTIRVVAERSSEDGSEVFTPFEHTYPLGALGSDPSFELTFDVTIDEPSEGELGLDEMAAAITHWRPAVASPAGDLVGEWFTTDGRLEIPSITETRDAFGDASSALGGLGSDEPTGPSDQRLTAVWLEYETSGPGLDPRIERRDLLRHDQAEPADVGAALLGKTTILVQTSDIHPDAFYRLLLENTVEARNALIALTFMAAAREDERILPALEQADLAPTNLYAMALARGRWGADAATSYIGRPNVWSEHQRFERTDAGLVDRYIVDIVHNEIDVVGSAPADAFRTRLEQGVLDTLVEHALLDSPASDNAFARFDAALEGGEVWQSFTDAAELADAGAGLPLADLERMRASIEAGHIVVSDLQPIEGVVTWWRIDPATGQALGMGVNGWGSVSERVGTHQVPASVLKTFQRTQGSSTARAGRDLARQAARYARNNPTPQSGSMTVFELVGGVIQRIYIL